MLGRMNERGKVGGKRGLCHKAGALVASAGPQ